MWWVVWWVGAWVDGRVAISMGVGRVGRVFRFCFLGPWCFHLSTAAVWCVLLRTSWALIFCGVVRTAAVLL